MPLSEGLLSFSSHLFGISNLLMCFQWLQWRLFSHSFPSWLCNSGHCVTLLSVTNNQKKHDKWQQIFFKITPTSVLRFLMLSPVKENWRPQNNSYLHLMAHKKLNSVHRFSWFLLQLKLTSYQVLSVKFNFSVCESKTLWFFLFLWCCTLMIKEELKVIESI